MGGVTIKLEGIGDVIKTFDELAQEIGDKKARSKILIPAARDAMRPVLALAQQNAPVDSGALRLLLQVEVQFARATGRALPLFDVCTGSYYDELNLRGIVLFRSDNDILFRRRCPCFAVHCPSVPT